MRERPIHFPTDSQVRAALEGRKTERRVPVKPQPIREESSLHVPGAKVLLLPQPGGLPRRVSRAVLARECPLGWEGDRLWLREAARVSAKFSGGGNDWYALDFRAGGPSPTHHGRLPGRWFPDRTFTADGVPRWCSPMQIPRWASRLTLEITEVRVERLQEINEAGVFAEGVQIPINAETGNPLLRLSGPFAPALYLSAGYTSADLIRAHFASEWDTAHARRGFGWDANPWVWVIGFRRVEAA